MALQVGDTAPNFTLTDQHGTETTLWESLDSHATLLVFYPLSYSGVCRGELDALQANLRKLQSLGGQVLAISVDSMHVQRSFAQHRSYDFSLLADFWPHGEVAQRYEVFNAVAGVANRATFILDADRKIRSLIQSESHTPRDVEEYFSALRAIASSS
ncbi:MAG: redoxin domain-containing protein [Canibacter sp.]